MLPGGDSPAASTPFTHLLHPLHEARDHPLLARLLEAHRELVPVDLAHRAVAEFLVEHALAAREIRRAARPAHCGPLDRHRRLHEASGPAVARGRACLRTLPARRVVARRERLGTVETR